jgi:hypothetical protein
MIRQIVSCDICGEEKEQTNHWFVAYDQGGEFRISGLTPTNSQDVAAKHLCGESCVHKLLDEFLTSLEAGHRQPAAPANSVSKAQAR